MKLRFLLAAAVASILTLTSCDKDDDVTQGPINPQAKKLKKVTRTEAGITTVFTLNYDANNRLTSYRSANNSEYVIFSYDANGNLTGVEEQEVGFKNIYTYTYANNLPVTGLFKSWELENGQPVQLIEDDRLTYTVTNNKVTGILLEMLQENEEMELDLTYTNGNLTRVVTTGQIPYTADFTFGTRRSAFPKVTNFVLDQAGFSLHFACNNDMLTARFDFPGTQFDSNVANQYTYDSNGYVLTSNDGTEQLVYEYQ
jgi:YD repeat-containing protein